MMQLTLQMRILVSVEPTDFRAGIDGRVCRAALMSDPFSGAVFVFRNRGSTAIKLLAYDGWAFSLLARPRWQCSARAVGARASGVADGRRPCGDARLARVATDHAERHRQTP
jgi:transposase